MTNRLNRIFFPEAFPNPLHDNRNERIHPFDFLNSELTNKGFPPYDLIQLDESNIRFRFAVAGYTQDDLNVEFDANNGNLIVSSNKLDQQQQGKVLFQGIAKRAFRKQFHIGTQASVKDVRLANGMLEVDVSYPTKESNTQKLEIKSET